MTKVPDIDLTPMPSNETNSIKPTPLKSLGMWSQQSHSMCTMTKQTNKINQH